MAYVFDGEDGRTGCVMLRCTKHNVVFARVEIGCPECWRIEAEAFDLGYREVAYHYRLTDEDRKIIAQDIESYKSGRDEGRCAPSDDSYYNY